MAGEAQDTQIVKEEIAQGEEAAMDIESQIKDAMRARVPHFKKQADSLTFEGVRRLLEKDLGLEKFTLDVHKRFVKQCLLECLDEAVDENASKDSGKIGEKHVDSVGREVAESTEDLESKSNTKEPCSEDEEKMEDSPVMGLLTGQKIKSKKEKTEASENKEVPNETNIRKALWKRASYIKANSEEVTMAGLRRLLEEDLKLAQYALDPYKKFISSQLDEVLKSREVSEPKKKILKKNFSSKASKKVSSEESSDSLDKETDEEDEVKTKRKIGLARKMQNSDGPKKRKIPEKETKFSGKKRAKSMETAVEDNSDVEGSGNASEDGHSQSSTEKPLKKKEASILVYGKHVEHLKSVIKSCGMSVPPVVYKKVKQVAENKREAQLIKELEDILSKEGLSSNPSEKEIKEVRRRKERAKELEGIDTSNIVSTSRRRSTTSFVAPPKPKMPVESDADDSNDDDDDNDNEEEEEEEEEDDDEENDDGDDESQSDELDEEHEDSD